MTSLLTEATSRSLEVAGVCLRKYYFKYIICRVLITSARVLRVGTAWHKIQEMMWHGKELVEIVESLKKKPIEPVDAAKLVALLMCYKMPKFESVTLEQDFEFIEHDVKIRGRIDLYVEDTDEVVDYKTTSYDLDNISYWAGRNFNLQMMLYQRALDSTGFVYNITKIPGLKMTEKEDNNELDKYRDRVIADIKKNPDKYFAWKEFYPTAEEKERWLIELRHQIDELRFAYERNVWPRRSSGCRTAYGKCEYVNVCEGFERIENNDVFRTKSCLHEELMKEDRP